MALRAVRHRFLRFVSCRSRMRVLTGFAEPVLPFLPRLTSSGTTTVVLTAFFRNQTQILVSMTDLDIPSCLWPVDHEGEQKSGEASPVFWENCFWHAQRQLAALGPWAADLVWSYGYIIGSKQVRMHALCFHPAGSRRRCACLGHRFGRISRAQERPRGFHPHFFVTKRGSWST